jgi:hypothetical protein
MDNPGGKLLQQAKVLVQAVEVRETMYDTGWVERIHAWFSVQAYRGRLTGLMSLGPESLAEEILSASQRVGDVALSGSGE